MVGWFGRSVKKEHNTVLTKEFSYFTVLQFLVPLSVDIMFRQAVMNCGSIGVVISRVNVGYGCVS